MSDRPAPAVAALAAVLALAACARDPAHVSPEARADRAQSLLVQGVAHSEIGQWADAIASFDQARALAPEEPVLAFGLAVAHFRKGELAAAAEWLDGIGDGAPAAVRGRVEYLRGKLALEEGDIAEEAAAYRRAVALDPTEPAYPYALSQVITRGEGAAASAEVRDWLEGASELWPENTRVTAELAQWLLGTADPAAWGRGLELTAELAAGQLQAEALVDRGRAELAADPERSPASARRALNVLRAGKRFQADAAALTARLEVQPLAGPLTGELGRRRAPDVAAVSWDAAPLLPAIDSAGEIRVLAVAASNDAVGGIAGGAREADLTLLTDRGVWFLGRDADAWHAVTEGAPGEGEILVGELDGDGWMEILVLGANGVELWGRADGGAWSRRALEPGLERAAGLRDGLLVDFESDGDLDLLARDGEGRLVLVTHRGEAGLGVPEAAPLAIDGAVERLVATDLDNDGDRDLLIATADAIHVVRNWRQGEYALAAALPISGELAQLLTLDYDGDGRFDLVAIAGGRLRFWRNRGVLGLESDGAAAAAASELLGSATALAAAAGDLDLDGDVDLLVAHGAAGAARVDVLLNGGGALERRPGPGALATAIEGLALLDLDGDRDGDLVAWGEKGLATARASGAEAQGSLVVALRGLVGKVPLDGRGATLEVAFGLDRRTVELERPEAILGLGGRAPALVTVTWPNGISEYLFAPEAGTAQLVEEELRIEGSCPFLYASDGEEMRFVTDILSLAPLGMLADRDTYVPADPEEYLRLPDWVAWDEAVELRITEELREVAYLDRLELVVVDAPEPVEVYNGERWFEGRVAGLDLRLLGPLEPPVAVRDDQGREVLDIVAELDHRYLTNFSRRRLYQGAVGVHSLELELRPALAASGRAALVLTGWLHWGNTSTNVARAQDPRGQPVFPYLEVPAGDGAWKRVALDVGLPAGKTKPIVVDLTGVVDATDPRVRLTTDFEVYWDRIAVARSLADETPHHIHRLDPSSAELSYGGFARWYRPADNGPYLFDYADRRAYPWRPTPAGERPIAWQEHEGFYTPFGDVRALVAAIDDRLAVFGSGEHLAVSFSTSALPPLPEGWRRTLFLHSEGWEKDGDPNVACSQTVGPLPSRALGAYPCPGVAEAPGAAGAPPPSQEGRWVDRERLLRRVRAWGESSMSSSPESGPG